MKNKNFNFGSGSQCLPVERGVGALLFRSRAAAVYDLEYDLFSVAAHEAGHAVISGHFKLFEAVFVAGRGYGRCFHGAGTPLQNAAVSWGGNFGENMLGVPSRHNKRPLLTLSRETLPKHVAACDESCFSPPDWEGIAGCPDRLLSARLAFSILTNRKFVLEKFADFLAILFRKAFFEPRFQNAAAQVDSVLKNCFSDGLYWLEALENFRRCCKEKGAPDSQRLPIEQINLEMMQINPDWILMPRQFLAKLLKQKHTTNRKQKNEH
jgi:hypothetical protein